jgi:hypothetical protein
LYQSGVLGEEEAGELREWWHKEFDRAWDPHFSFAPGLERFSPVPVARDKHYAWMDLPPELHQKWTTWFCSAFESTPCPCRETPVRLAEMSEPLVR